MKHPQWCPVCKHIIKGFGARYYCPLCKAIFYIQVEIANVDSPIIQDPVD